jgi:hypothetical protein
LTAIVFRATGWTDADWLGVLSGGDFYYLVLATGFFFVSTAREKLEDERIAYLRARAWQWAAFVFGLGFVLTCLFFTTDMVLLILPIRSGSFGSDATDIALELLNMQAVIFLALFVLRFQLYLYHDRRQSAKVEAA